MSTVTETQTGDTLKKSQNGQESPNSSNEKEEIKEQPNPLLEELKTANENLKKDVEEAQVRKPFLIRITVLKMYNVTKDEKSVH